LLGSSLIKIQAATKPPDADNVKGGALAATSTVSIRPAYCRETFLAGPSALLFFFGQAIARPNAYAVAWDAVT
jgi:hypothetical protein